MKVTRAILYLAIPVNLILTGCEMAGPADIRNGRPNYNDAIHDTSKEQVFLNIVRVANREPPFFMDITEVDASVSVNASLAGSFGKTYTDVHSKSGTTAAAGSTSVLTGSLSPTLSYTESPTIRYQPLQGQALIAQISTPLTPDSIQALIDSRWPMSAVLSLAVERLTPDSSKYYQSLDAILLLHRMGAIVISSEPTQYLVQPTVVQAQPIQQATSRPGGDALSRGGQFMMSSAGGGGGAGPSSPPGSGSSQSASSSSNSGSGSGSTPNNTIAIYFALSPDQEHTHKLAFDLWKHLLSIYGSWADPADKGLPTRIEIPAVFTFKSSPPPKCPLEVLSSPSCTVVTNSKLSPSADDSQHELEATIKTTCTVSVVPRTMPVLHLRSALGVLHALVDDWTQMSLVISPEQLACLKRKGLLKSPTTREYYVLPAEFRDLRLNTEGDSSLGGEVRPEQWSGPTVCEEYKKLGLLSDNERVFMLIVQSKTAPPSDAFVSVQTKGSYYYIDKEDLVSQQTFALMTQLLTMQALPNQSAPLTPTIPVGGSH